jgi:3-hydroxybenzoate 6-monooxygenase
MDPKDHPILIVGGGLGGLTAALALGHRGWRVQVLEQAPEIEPIGYGIQLGPNVFHMLERLGLVDAVLAQSHFPSACVWLDAEDGCEIERVPTGAELRRRFRYPYVVIHRVDLHRVLLDACHGVPNIELRPSTTVTGFEEPDGRIRAVTDRGRIEGAAIVGADGLRSRIRAQLFGDAEPHMIGYVAHRTVLPMAQVPAHVRRDDVCLWAGPGFHIVHYPLRRGELFNIVAVFRTPTYADKLDLSAYAAEIRRTYETAHPVMKTLLGLMDFERRWIIADRDPIRAWSRGRVTLLGDAAHPALQSLAQGACMAIEDGVCLAELVELASGDHAAAFLQYQTARVVRTARLQLECRHLWDVYHAEGLARDVVRQTYAERSDADVYQCLAWLYDGFAPPTELRRSVSRLDPPGARAPALRRVAAG